MKQRRIFPIAAVVLGSVLGLGRLRGQEPATKPAATTEPVQPSTPPAAPPTASPAATGGQVPPAGGAAAPAADPTRYILSPDDTLQITVWKEPSFSGSVPVRPDGMISMSLMGDLPAAGLTPMQLGMDIATRLKKYIQDPNVTVTVLSVRPKQVFLLGEVGHVGPLTITREMTPLQAIAAAGGLTPYAKAKSIYILRGAAGHQTKVPYNYKKALKSGDEQGVSLMPGDTIVVP